MLNVNQKLKKYSYIICPEIWRAFCRLRDCTPEINDSEHQQLDDFVAYLERLANLDHLDPIINKTTKNNKPRRWQ